jgi:hypothetical protein
MSFATEIVWPLAVIELTTLPLPEGLIEIFGIEYEDEIVNLPPE